MTTTVELPPSLRPLASGHARVQVRARNVREAIDAIDALHPGVRARVCDVTGNPRRTIEILRNFDDIRFLDNLDTPVGPESVVRIIATEASEAR